MTIQDLNALETERIDTVALQVCQTCFLILKEYSLTYGQKDKAYIDWALNQLAYQMPVDPFCSYFVFFQVYAYLKKRHQEKDFDTLLEAYHFHSPYSIKKAIYYLLSNKEETISLDPLLFPSIHSIKKKGYTYQVETNIGTIHVNKASKVFRKHPSSHLFRRKLGGECYMRSYDFLCENPSYTAVIQYVTQMFGDNGYYHVYLKKDNHVLDIAANAYYDSLKEANILLTGEIIKEVSLDTIERDFATLREEIKGVSEKQDKLKLLTLYYDAKRCKD